MATGAATSEDNRHHEKVDPDRDNGKKRKACQEAAERVADAPNAIPEADFGHAG